MTNGPKVSVLIPSLNVEMYIRECMESVINQTLCNIEIICVDAGSTDNTLNILEEYAGRDSRIKIIHSAKKSYGYQLNLGIEASHGEYIGIVESDDYIASDMFQRLTEVADRYELDLIKADYYRFFREGINRIFEYCPAINDPDYYGKVLDPYQNRCRFMFHIVPWTGIYRTSFIKRKQVKLNESPGASYQDNGLWWMTMTQTNRVMFLNEAFYRVRRDNPNSSIKSTEKVYCMCEEYNYIRDFLHTHPEIEQRFAPVIAYYRMHNYYFTLSRIAPKFRKEFLQRFSEDFKKIEADKELDITLYTEEQWERLHKIMKTPFLYYFATYTTMGRVINKIRRKVKGI